MDEEWDVVSSNAAEVVQGTEGTITRFFDRALKVVASGTTGNNITNGNLVPDSNDK